MRRMLAGFAAEESGATAIEYGLIAAFVALVIIGAISAVGGNVGGMFQSVSDKVDAAASSTSVN
ncbi:MAG TPA: Flp family type IVb pilin [Devosia sp.]|nr:Flp family type IVb pilin [Devosia sp.]